MLRALDGPNAVDFSEGCCHHANIGIWRKLDRDAVCVSLGLSDTGHPGHYEKEVRGLIGREVRGMGRDEVRPHRVVAKAPDVQSPA